MRKQRERDVIPSESEKVVKSRAEMIRNKLFYERHKLKVDEEKPVARRYHRDDDETVPLALTTMAAATEDGIHSHTENTASDLLYLKRESLQSVTPAAIFMNFYDR